MIAGVMGVSATRREITPNAINANAMTAKLHSTARPYVASGSHATLRRSDRTRMRPFRLSRACYLGQTPALTNHGDRDADGHPVGSFMPSV